MGRTGARAGRGGGANGQREDGGCEGRGRDALTALVCGDGCPAFAVARSSLPPGESLSATAGSAPGGPPGGAPGGGPGGAPGGGPGGFNSAPFCVPAWELPQRAPDLGSKTVISAGAEEPQAGCAQLARPGHTTFCNPRGFSARMGRRRPVRQPSLQHGACERSGWAHACSSSARSARMLHQGWS